MSSIPPVRRTCLHSMGRPVGSVSMRTSSKQGLVTKVSSRILSNRGSFCSICSKRLVGRVGGKGRRKEDDSVQSVRTRMLSQVPTATMTARAVYPEATLTATEIPESDGPIALSDRGVNKYLRDDLADGLRDQYVLLRSSLKDKGVIPPDAKDVYFSLSMGLVSWENEDGTRTVLDKKDAFGTDAQLWDEYRKLKGFVDNVYPKQVGSNYQNFSATGKGVEGGLRAARRNTPVLHSSIPRDFAGSKKAVAESMAASGLSPTERRDGLMRIAAAEKYVTTLTEKLQAAVKAKGREVQTLQMDPSKQAECQAAQRDLNRLKRKLAEVKGIDLYVLCMGLGYVIPGANVDEARKRALLLRDAAAKKQTDACDEARRESSAIKRLVSPEPPKPEYDPGFDADVGATVLNCLDGNADPREAYMAYSSDADCTLKADSILDLVMRDVIAMDRDSSSSYTGVDSPSGRHILADVEASSPLHAALTTALTSSAKEMKQIKTRVTKGIPNADATFKDRKPKQVATAVDEAASTGKAPSPPPKEPKGPPLPGPAGRHI